MWRNNQLMFDVCVNSGGSVQPRKALNALYTAYLLDTSQPTNPVIGGPFTFLAKSSDDAMRIATARFVEDKLLSVEEAGDANILLTLHGFIVEK